MIRNFFSRLGFAIMAVFFTAILIYFVLLSGELALAYLTRPGGEEVERLQLLRQRIQQEDLQLRKEALKDGFKPVISPGNIESSWKLKSLALELDVGPLAPQPHSDLYLCNEGYGLVRYKSDRFGFRNPDQAWENDVDVVIIGDSFVHGACVEDADTIAAHLRPRFNVLNLGTIGNNPINYASIAKAIVPKIDAKFIVVVFYANDFDSGGRFSFNYLMHFANTPQYFKTDSSSMELSEAMTNFYKEAEKIVVAEVMSDLDGASLKERFSPSDRYLSGKRFELRLLREQVVALFRKYFPDASMPFGTKLAIDTLDDVCRRNGCTPVIAYIPSSPKWHPNSDSELFSALLSEYAHAKGLQFIDGAPALRRLGDSAYARMGGHLSPQGYKTFADELAENLSPSGPQQVTGR